jgi:hypothetical protein
VGRRDWLPTFVGLNSQYSFPYINEDPVVCVCFFAFPILLAFFPLLLFPTEIKEKQLTQMQKEEDTAKEEETLKAKIKGVNINRARQAVALMVGFLFLFFYLIYLYYLIYLI